MAKLTSSGSHNMTEVDTLEIHSPLDIASAADQLINFELQLNERHSNDKVNPYSMLSIKCKDVKSNLNTSKSDSKSFVIDSGAFPHMWNDLSAFIAYSPWNPSNDNIKNVTLTDEASTAEIKGLGSIAIRIKQTVHIINKVLCLMYWK